MKIFYHVQNDEEMEICKFLVAQEWGNENQCFAILSLVAPSVDEIQLCIADSVMLIHGTYDLTKGYTVNTIPQLPITGFQIKGNSVVYYVSLPEKYFTHNISTVCFEMTGIP